MQHHKLQAPTMTGAPTMWSSAVPSRRGYLRQPPVTAPGHTKDVGSHSLLPTISVDQYGATMAKWFDLSDTQLANVFPNITNFSNRDLGFMG